jgi:hypothetical protein
MLVCSRCQRANPDEAAFCHFDGAELRRVNGEAAKQRHTHLPHEFVFPSGRRCYTYDELVVGCQAEWDTARDLLREGVFKHFLTSIGRIDLAQAAQEPKPQADADTALENFLARMPVRVENSARLDLNPRRIQVGPLHIGESRQIPVTILNQGTGFLRGTLAVLDGENWLVLESGKSGNECLIRTPHEQRVTLRVDTRGLAAPHRHSAKLTVITNGGVAEVPVRLDLEARPFDQPPFQGVGTPREMAERMRAQPKPAVPLLESGAIALWFAENGWNYPVSGPTARGVAAVQQFFEGMGLSKPPGVHLAEESLVLECASNGSASGQLTLRTDSRKWVYARIESGASWLTIDTPQVSGPQQAVIELTVHGRLLPDLPQVEAPVRVTANGGQVLTGLVKVAVKRPRPLAGTKQFRPVLIGALAGALLRLAFVIPADLWARVWSVEARPGFVPGALATWLTNPLVDMHFLHQFVLVTWWLSGLLYGLVLWRRPGPRVDVVAGVIAGSAAGLAISATVACLLCLMDTLPRGILSLLVSPTGGTGSPWVGTALWVLVAVLSWAGWGAILSGALVLAGEAGARFRTTVASAVANTLTSCGLGRASAYLHLQKGC